MNKPLALLLSLAVAFVALPARADANSDLVAAAYAGNLAGVQAQLRRGASFNARDENGYTPLHWAVYGGHVGLASYMLARGADVNARDDDGVTPLMLAGWRGDAMLVRLLMSYRADRNRRSAQGFLAYDYAGANGHFSVQKLLASPAIAPGWDRVVPGRPGALTSPDPDAEPTVDPDAEYVDLEATDPTPAPTWRPAPGMSPSASPSPSPSPSPTREPGTSVSLVGGYHLSKLSFPIVGVHLQQRLHDWVSLRAGYEQGRLAQSSGTALIDFGYTRLHGALLSNGPLYLGLGLTHVSVNNLWSGGYNPSRLSYEGIAGLRYGIGFVLVSTEFRFGVDGPSTVTASLGGRF